MKQKAIVAAVAWMFGIGFGLACAPARAGENGVCYDAVVRARFVRQVAVPSTPNPAADVIDLSGPVLVKLAVVSTLRGRAVPSFVNAYSWQHPLFKPSHIFLLHLRRTSDGWYNIIGAGGTASDFRRCAHSALLARPMFEIDEPERRLQDGDQSEP